MYVKTEMKLWSGRTPQMQCGGISWPHGGTNTGIVREKPQSCAQLRLSAKTEKGENVKLSRCLSKFEDRIFGNLKVTTI
ncbi:hypothetical protein PN36_34540 [Candidatus Thiomargarita nelsonii]|uniref:Uncharacterized protein n=1 Tax=Candidatus Thiomargarita nelsonii TaxID=1003181 RepID=A0A4E0RM58_9GAMM|nr:hypothetical protein PN36_34540 [Candidatus Thiomargarita nelsonii]